MSAIPTAEALKARIKKARAKLRERPDLASVEAVGEGERSAWRFPRPPRVAPASGVFEVFAGDVQVARSERVLEVLETSAAPVPYFPVEDITGGELVATDEWALCEWKGVTVYFDLTLPGRTLRKVGWRIPDPLGDLGRPYALLKDYAAFLPAEFTCRRDGVAAEPQPGDYYGGWITSEVKGPFKGGEGSQDW